MGSVVLIDGVTGQKIKAAEWNANNAQLRAALNAGLDKTNMSASPDLPASVLHGYPSDGAKVLAGDGTWINASLTKTKYGQVDVAGTTTETALISQTISGGALGVNGILRGHMEGDFLQNSGGSANGPRLKLYYGAAAIIDTGTAAAAIGNGANRYGWTLDFWVANQDTAHQYAKLAFWMGVAGTGGGGVGIGAIQADTSTLAPTVSLIYLWYTNGLVNVDSTVNQTLALKTINASAAGSYSTRMQSGLVEQL